MGVISQLVYNTLKSLLLYQAWHTISSEGPGSTQQLQICIENAGDKGKHQLSVQLFSSVSQKRRIDNTHRLFRAKNETDTLQVAPRCMGGDQNVSSILYVLRVRKKIKAIEHPQLAIMLPLFLFLLMPLMLPLTKDMLEAYGRIT